jgi:hypothetical protein
MVTQGRGSLVQDTHHARLFYENSDMLISTRIYSKQRLHFSSKRGVAQVPLLTKTCNGDKSGFTARNAISLSRDEVSPSL